MGIFFRISFPLLGELTVTIKCNSFGTVGLRETAPYRDLKEDIHVYLSDDTQCIGTGAFKNWKHLLSVTYCGNHSVKIGTVSFSGCENLKTFAFSSTGEVASQAFKDCASLHFLNLSKTTLINRNVFEGCNCLSGIRVYENCTFRGDAFSNPLSVELVDYNGKIVRRIEKFCVETSQRDKELKFSDFQ